MVAGHPVDSRGRVLPESSWPADRHAPGDLELVRRFCNTRNRENGADRFETAQGLATWLDSQGLPQVEIDQAELIRLGEVRELLHAHCVAHRLRVPASGDKLGALDGLTFQVRSVDAALTLIPSAPAGTSEHLIERLVLIVYAAQSNGTWPRLKACRGCGWTVYDTSKNQSGRWCSMRACGGRSKVYAYRDRRRTD